MNHFFFPSPGNPLKPPPPRPGSAEAGQLAAEARKARHGGHLRQRAALHHLLEVFRQRIGIEPGELGLHLLHFGCVGHALAAAHHLAEHALAAAHLLHHGGHLEVHLEQPVDLLDLGAGARGDALLALAVELLRVAPLVRRHRADDGQLAVQHLLVEIDAFQLLLDLAHAGQHVHHAAHAAELLQLLQLVGEVLEVEGALAHPVGDLLGLLLVDLEGGPLDQRDHVAHAEDAAGDALGVEILQPVELLAGAHELDRLAGDGAHGERRAAAAIAVDAGQHDAGDADLLVEGAGEIDRVLAGQRVGDQQGFLGLGDVAHGGRFGQQFLVDVEAARGVEHDHVVAALAGLPHGALGDLHRGLALDDGERVHLDLLAEDGELLLRRRAAGVERGHQHLALLALLRRLAILAVVVVLPEPCRPTIRMATGGRRVD